MKWRAFIGLVCAVAAAWPFVVIAQQQPGPSPEQEQLPQLLRGFLHVVEDDIQELKTSIEQLKTSIEQLKTSQEQMIRNNAAVAEQLKATQEQMGRLIAKTSEQQLLPKTSAPPPRSIATATGKPVPKFSSPQARAQPKRGRPE
jgi:TolA-binding protein